MKKLLTILLIAAMMRSTCTVFALTDASAETASVDISEYINSFIENNLFLFFVCLLFVFLLCTV